MVKILTSAIPTFFSSMMKTRNMPLKNETCKFEAAGALTFYRSINFSLAVFSMFYLTLIWSGLVNLLLFCILKLPNEFSRGFFLSPLHSGLIIHDDQSREYCLVFKSNLGNRVHTFWLEERKQFTWLTFQSPSFLHASALPGFRRRNRNDPRVKDHKKVTVNISSLHESEQPSAFH